jgi:hypothetical protein
MRRTEIRGRRRYEEPEVGREGGRKWQSSRRRKGRFRGKEEVESGDWGGEKKGQSRKKKMVRWRRIDRLRKS